MSFHWSRSGWSCSVLEKVVTQRATCLTPHFGILKSKNTLIIISEMGKGKKNRSAAVQKAASLPFSSTDATKSVPAPSQADIKETADFHVVELPKGVKREEEEGAVYSKEEPEEQHKRVFHTRAAEKHESSGPSSGMDHQQPLTTERIPSPEKIGELADSNSGTGLAKEERPSAGVRHEPKEAIEALSRSLEKKEETPTSPLMGSWGSWFGALRSTAAAKVDRLYEVLDGTSSRSEVPRQQSLDKADTVALASERPETENSIKSLFDRMQSQPTQALQVTCNTLLPLPIYRKKGMAETACSSKPSTGRSILLRAPFEPDFSDSLP